MPSPSYFPIVASIGLLIIAYGMILGRTNGTNYLVSVFGLLVVLSGLYGWALEPSAAPDDEPHPPDGQPALVPAGSTARSLEAGTAGASGALEPGPPASPEQPGGSEPPRTTNGGPPGDQPSTEGEA
jgi:hypothetical protein